jgi:hypothetical protein
MGKEERNKEKEKRIGPQKTTERELRQTFWSGRGSRSENV